MIKAVVEVVYFFVLSNTKVEALDYSYVGISILINELAKEKKSISLASRHLA
jgi:hypothetical protein